MKRDMELIRRILFASEDENPAQEMKTLRDEGHSEEQIRFHVFLMGEAGLVRTIADQGDNDRYPSADVLCITWQGYEFLDAARADSTWQKATQLVKQKGLALPFDLLKEVLVMLARQALFDS